MPNRSILQYEIGEKLGEGGMAVVWKAWDRKLERPVALKFISASWGKTPLARARFLQEARSVSALNHSHIATIYDVVEHEGETFLVLEYLAGSSLRDKLGNPLPRTLALSYALQMARGLAHAHRRGIVHRDVKPENVLFDAEGALKITDFGLARLMTGAARLTDQGLRIGTAAYMSPEQARGEEVDARTDVFALGVVLYEMLAGKPPFGGSLPDAVVNNVLHSAPAPLPDPGLNAIVQKALAKRPEARYANMEAFAAALESAVRPSDPSLLPTAEAPAIPPRSRRAWVVGLLFLLAVGAGAWLYGLYRPQLAPTGSLLLLADIADETGQPDFPPVTGLLRGQLGQSAYFNLADDMLMAEILRQMVRPKGEKLDLPTAREIAWRGHIPLLLAGSLIRLERRYQLNLHLELTGDQPGQPRQQWAKSFPANDANEMFDVIREASRWVRRTAGEAAADVELRDLPVSQTTTISWEALKLYTQAEKSLTREREDDAILLLQEAVRIDPDFALAHMRLGDRLVARGRYAEGYEYWRKAVSASSRRQLSKREELRIQALYALDTGDYRSGERHSRFFVLHFPSDYYPRFLHGMALEWLGRPKEAFEEFAEAERLNPNLFQMPAHLAMTRIGQGRHLEATVHIQRLRSLGQHSWALFLESASKFLQGDSEGALASVDRLASATSKEWKSRAFALRGLVLFETGRAPQAAQALQEGEKFDALAELPEARANKLLALAGIALRRKDSREVHRLTEEALLLEASPKRLRLAGIMLARAGLAAEAGRLLTRLGNRPEPVFQIAKSHLAGEIALAENRKGEALGHLLRAHALEAPARPRDYLARAYWAAGQNQTALDHYEQVLASIGLVWSAPEEEIAGLWSDSLLQTAKLRLTLNKAREFTPAIEQYLKLTSHAAPGGEEAVQGQRLLAEARAKKLIP